MSMIKVSVIVPVYGVERYIQRFIDSLFTQTMLEGVEFIFVNDCTKDNSISILENAIHTKYSNLIPQISIYHNESNQGSDFTRQIGLSKARGEYILCVDSDDFLDKEMIEELYDEAVRGNYDVVISDYKLQVGNKFVNRVQKPDKLNGKDCVASILSMKMHGSWCNKLIKRSILQNNPIMYPEKGRNMLEDLMMTVQILYYADRIGYIDKAYYNYCSNDASVTHTLSLSSLASMLYAYDFVNRFFDMNQIQDKALRSALGYFRISTLSGVALNDVTNRLSVNFSMYDDLFWEIPRHPYLSWSYKIALMARIKHLKWLFNLLLNIRKALR